MDDKKEIVLMPCRCGDQRPIVAQITRGRCCPTRAIGTTQAEAQKNWNEERAKDAGSGKGN